VSVCLCARCCYVARTHCFFRFVMYEGLVEAADLATLQLYSLVSYCEGPSLTHSCLHPRSLSLLFLEHCVSSNCHV
jgi:hypothetical protein